MLPPIPPKLDLAQTPTPLRPLDRVSALLGGPRIWIKCDDQTGSLLSGNKIRKLEFCLAEAISLGVDRVITCGGLQSNHCRATAVAAAQLGLKSHLILRGDSHGPSSASGEPYSIDELQAFDQTAIDGNLLLGWEVGAEVSIYHPEDYAEYLEEYFSSLSHAYESRGESCYLIPTGASNGTGLWGYILAAQELLSDFAEHNIDPEAVVCATGSGGTQGGLTLGFHALGSALQVHGVAVCDSEAYFDRKVRGDIEEWRKAFALEVPSLENITQTIPVSTIDNYIGPGYARAYPEMLETMMMLARQEGVILDPVYTGKAFHGLVSEIKKGRFDAGSDVVFIHTGGVYGVFPFREQLVGTRVLP